MVVVHPELTVFGGNPDNVVSIATVLWIGIEQVQICILFMNQAGH